MGYIKFYQVHACLEVFVDCMVLIKKHLKIIIHASLALCWNQKYWQLLMVLYMYMHGKVREINVVCIFHHTLLPHTTTWLVMSNTSGDTTSTVLLQACSKHFLTGAAKGCSQEAYSGRGLCSQSQKKAHQDHFKAGSQHSHIGIIAS